MSSTRPVGGGAPACLCAVQPSRAHSAIVSRNIAVERAQGGTRLPVLPATRSRSAAQAAKAPAEAVAADPLRPCANLRMVSGSLAAADGLGQLRQVSLRRADEHADQFAREGDDRGRSGRAMPARRTAPRPRRRVVPARLAAAGSARVKPAAAASGSIGLRQIIVHSRGQALGAIRRQRMRGQCNHRDIRISHRRLATAYLPRRLVAIHFAASGNPSAPRRSPRFAGLQAPRCRWRRPEPPLRVLCKSRVASF